MPVSRPIFVSANHPVKGKRRAIIILPNKKPTCSVTTSLSGTVSKQEDFSRPFRNELATLELRFKHIAATMAKRTRNHAGKFILRAFISF